MTEPTFTLTIRPVRFTNDVAAMREFLTVLGLRPRIESQGGRWVDMVGSAGMVALHEAANADTGVAGQTSLSAEVDNADALAEALQAAGYDDATVYDESYARVLTVTDPLGDQVIIDEAQDDLYGFARVGDDVTPGPQVVPVRFTNDAESYGRFLTALGLTGTPDPDYATYDGGRGRVGLHHLYGSPDELPVVGEGAVVHLTLLTDDLDRVERDCAAAGIATVRHDEDFGSFLDLTDPDGQSVQVHTA